MEDIHGIRPPVTAGFDTAVLQILLTLFGVAALLAVLFFIIKKMWRKKTQTKELKYLPAPENPYDAALKQLDLLSGNAMSDPRLFYFDLTAVLRNYIGRSFHINAIEMTSQEFVKNMNRLDFDRGIKKRVSKFVDISDSFKYAGITPLKAQADKDFEFVKQNITKIEETLDQQKDEVKKIQEPNHEEGK